MSQTELPEAEVPETTCITNTANTHPHPWSTCFRLRFPSVSSQNAPLPTYMTVICGLTSPSPCPRAGCTAILWMTGPHSTLRHDTLRARDREQQSTDGSEWPSSGWMEAELRPTPMFSLTRAGPVTESRVRAAGPPHSAQSKYLMRLTLTLWTPCNQSQGAGRWQDKLCVQLTKTLPQGGCWPRLSFWCK